MSFTSTLAALLFGFVSDSSEAMIVASGVALGGALLGPLLTGMLGLRRLERARRTSDRLSSIEQFRPSDPI